MGYIRAASRFNPARGTSFRGFCAVRIRGAVLDEVRHWDWTPRSVRRKHKRITLVTFALAEHLEREPTASELAAALGVGESDLAAMQTITQPRQMVSFDELAENRAGDETLPLAERLADPAVLSPDARVCTTEDRRALVQCIGRLPKTQATVIVLHYLQNVPLRDVALLLHITPSRVSQLHRGALVRMRTVWTGGSQAP